MNIWQTVQDLVVECDPLPGLFNPYAQLHDVWDQPASASIRLANLKQYLQDHEGGVELFLLAEAPGPWGCRFSGVPITSEAQLVDPLFPGSGDQSTTRDRPFTEYSASIYWKILQPYYRSIFTWSAVPFHPFHPDQPDSIRTPRQSEINMFLPVVAAFVEWARPKKILAVGRKAENALARLGLTASYIRHPSQGGARIFEEGVLAAIAELGIQPDNVGSYER